MSASPSSLRFRNDWKPEPIPTVDVDHVLSRSPEEYDVNFCFPRAVRVIENDLVRLVPYVPSLHARELFDGLKPYPDMFRFWPVGPYTDLADMVTMFERYRSMSHTLIYMVYDKRYRGNTALGATKDEAVNDRVSSYQLAGTVGFLWADPSRFSIEIGHLMTLPAFQRTYVTSNAIGLLCLLCLSEPASGASDTPTLGADGHAKQKDDTTVLFPYVSDERKSLDSSSSHASGNLIDGLGLRRVQYQANPLNTPSIRAAERFGFRLEGIVRWQRAVQVGKEAVRRAGDPADTMGGWHSTVLSLCFDDWNEQVIYTAMRPRDQATVVTDRDAAN